MNKTTDQSTRVRNAREEQTLDYAPMPVAQIQHGYDRWDAFVEVDADELARLRHGNARTVTTSTQIHVVDAGLMTLPYSRADSGEISRTFIRAAFNYDKATATVNRAAPQSVLGHTPYPAQPPLNESGHTRIAELFHEHVCAPYPTATIDLHDSPDTLDDYLDEVHAAIEHPDWCQRQDCWDRSPYSEVIHSRTVDAHQWDYDGIQHTVTAELEMCSETVTPGADDSTDMQVRITSTELGEVTLLGTPEDFRKLGQYLVTAADDLEWEFDDANKSTVNGVGIDWSWSITGNDEQAAGGDAR